MTVATLTEWPLLSDRLRSDSDEPQDDEDDEEKQLLKSRVASISIENEPLRDELVWLKQTLLRGPIC